MSWQRNEVRFTKSKYLFMDHYFKQIEIPYIINGLTFSLYEEHPPLWLLILYVFFELQLLMCLLEVVYYVPPRLLAIISIPLSCCLQQLMCLLAFFAFSLLSYGDRYYSTFYAPACVRD